MKMRIDNYGQTEWNEIVGKFTGLSLMQTWEYAEAKSKLSRWKAARAIFMEGTEIVGAAQCAIITVPFINRGLVWINHGPLFAKDGNTDNNKILPMLEELKKYWVDQNKMYLCVAPPIYEEGIEIKSIEDQGYRKVVSRKGWESAQIDLTKSLDVLRASLHQNWRRHVLKAEKLELECVIGSDQKLMGDLLRNYTLLIMKKKFKATVSPQMIQTMQEELPEDNKMIVFMAKKGEKKLGTVLIARFGKKCIYLVGAVTDEGKELHVNHYLFWEAIQYMKMKNYEIFDVGGASAELTPPGILQFKNGLGGAKYRLIGEFESHQNTFISKGIGWLINKARGS